MRYEVAYTLLENAGVFNHIATTYFNLTHDVAEKLYWKMVYTRSAHLSTLVETSQPKELKKILKKECINYLKSFYKVYNNNPDNLAALLDVNVSRDVIYDPCCGSGGFLIQYSSGDAINDLKNNFNQTYNQN